MEQSRWVLHEHDRPRHHFDLRLDHDIDHLGYVDDQKRIADTGTFTLVKRTEREVSVVLHGRTASTAYALIHTGDQNWLLHKLKRQPA